jgi:hypothetical protein
MWMFMFSADRRSRVVPVGERPIDIFGRTAGTSQI